MRRDSRDKCEVDGRSPRSGSPPGGKDSLGGYSFIIVSLGGRGGGLASWERGLTALAPSCLLPFSASVRLPASTVKLGEKLERYHTAVQVRGLSRGWASPPACGVVCASHPAPPVPRGRNP